MQGVAAPELTWGPANPADRIGSKYEVRLDGKRIESATNGSGYESNSFIKSNETLPSYADEMASKL